MVRTVFSVSLGLLTLLLLGPVCYPQDVEPLTNRLGLHTSKRLPCQTSSSMKIAPFSLMERFSPCASSIGKRFSFTQKRESISLLHVHSLSSLRYQGGRRLLQADHTVPLFSNVLSAGIEMAYRDQSLIPHSETPPTTQLSTKVLLKGSVKRMNYRAGYGFTDLDSGNVLSFSPNNRMGGNILWEWQLPFVTPKIELSRFTSTTDRDRIRKQTVSIRQRYSLDWKIPNWPSLTLGYSRDQKDTFTLSEKLHTHGTLTQRVTTKIAFEYPKGSGQWVSRYSALENNIKDQRALEELHSTLKGTFNIFQPIQFSPSLGFTERYNAKLDSSQTLVFAKLETKLHLSNWQTIQPSLEWNRLRIGDQLSNSDTLSSTLKYSCKPSEHGYHISIIGKYAVNQTTQYSSNLQMYDLSVFIKKDLQDLLDLSHQQQFVSLKFSHNQQVATVPSQNFGSNSTAMLLVNILP